MHDGFVENIQPLFLQGGYFSANVRTSTKANQSKRQRRKQFPVWRFLHPGSKEPSQTTMLTYASRQTIVAEVANNHPQLQCAKTSTKLNAIVRTATHLFLFRRAQIFRYQRKRASEQIHMTTIED